VTRNVTETMQGMIGSTEYRERDGVVRLAIGQLKHTPEELQTNIKAFMTAIKEDIAKLSDRLDKSIHEVVSKQN